MKYHFMGSTNIAVLEVEGFNTGNTKSRHWKNLSQLLHSVTSHKTTAWISKAYCGHFMWVPVTTSWRFLGLRMEKTAFRYGGDQGMYWISSRRQPTRDGAPAWVLGERLTSPHCKEPACYETLQRSSDLDGFSVTTLLTYLLTHSTVQDILWKVDSY